jgi:hypothetical protein
MANARCQGLYKVGKDVRSNRGIHVDRKRAEPSGTDAHRTERNGCTKNGPVVKKRKRITLFSSHCSAGLEKPLELSIIEHACTVCGTRRERI